jgi:glycosyltransferase involved in cell wall biosynthesis
MKIAVIANSGWYLYNFRRTLMHSLIAGGHEPVAISPVDDYAQRLSRQGFVHRPLKLAPSGTNPLRELATLLDLRSLLARENIEVAFTFTPKPNIYTGLAARGLGLTHVPNVSGLGRVFIRPSSLTPLVRTLYRFAFQGARTVVFQNEDDRRTFIGQGLVESHRTLRVPGSGVDLHCFAPPENDAPDEPVVFLLVARMLWDKGVGEFVAAARSLRRQHPNVRFELLGSARSDNPAAIPIDTLRQWQDEGLVAYFDHVDDVRPHIARSHCVVLPSYREGVPRTLLEAAAMARPLIATDVPGCRDTVDDGVNGFLCLPADSGSLEAAMRRFLELTVSERSAMGYRGRRKVEREFDEKVVLSTYLSLVGPPNRADGQHPLS